jgi:hypothetical protein
VSNWLSRTVSIKYRLEDCYMAFVAFTKPAGPRLNM